MSILMGGRFLQLIVAVFCIISVIISLQRANKGVLPELRRLAAIDAIGDVISRCAEEGKPALFTPFAASMMSAKASQTFSALSVLSYIARWTAKLSVPLFVTYQTPDAGPLIEELTRESYVLEGNLEEFNKDNLRYFPAMSYGASTLALMEREEVGANFMFGSANFATVMFAETGKIVGAMQVAGTATLSNVPFLVTSVDYLVMGDEFYCMGAYLSKDPLLVNSINMGDWIKIIFIGFTLISIILYNIGFQQITSIFSI